MPEPNDIQMPAAPEPPRRPMQRERQPSQPEAKSPPLFIKIDKYKELVQNLQRLKSYALSLRDALDALDDIEKELKTGIQLTQKALDDFNTIIAMMDTKLIRLSEGEDGGEYAMLKIEL